MRISFRRTLLLAFTGLIALLALALVLRSRSEERRLVREMAAELLERNQQLAEGVLADLVDPIRTELAVHVRQVRAGRVAPHDPVALKDLALPRMHHLRGVGSMMLGDADGYQCLLMRYDELVTRSPLLAGQTGLPPPAGDEPQFFTREFDLGRWGTTSRWILWDVAGQQPVASFERELSDYDPRERPWHQRALQRLAELETAAADGARAGPTPPAEHVAWTDAYTLFTSKTPGISASAAARAPDGRVLLFAYDLLLDDLSRFTRAHHPSPRGKLFITTGEGRVLGLPEDERFASEPERLAALLQPLVEVGDGTLGHWAAAWEARDRQPGVFQFSSGGESWWGSGAHFPLDGAHAFRVGLAVPRADLLELIAHDPRRLWWAAALGLALALVLTHWVARRVTRPLERLVARSRRIGALDLRPDPRSDSALAEIQDLDDALETMRGRLAAHMQDRERSAAALLESEERFRTTFELSAVGVVHTSLAGELLLVNETMARMLGRPAAALAGTRVADITHADDWPSDRRRMERMRAGELANDTWEKRYLRADGTWLWAQVSVSVRRDAGGRPRHFSAVVQDVSERRELEQRLLQSQKLEAVGRLAGGVAHDFNNLLTVIKGYASLVRRRLGAGDRAGPHVERILQAVEGGEGLTRQLLAFARKSPGQPRVVDAGASVREMGDLLRQLLDGDVRLEIDVAPGLHPVRIDPVQLQQVLVNLVVNARDALSAGGTIGVTVSSDPPDAEAPTVALAVHDEGTGIDPQVAPHIFDPFFTTKPVGQGTGLGLATCYGIAEGAGGRLDVTSTPGAGSTFSLRLPRAEGAVESPAAPARDGGTSASAVILVAEDDAHIRALLEIVLREAGYEVAAAGRGEEALALAADLPRLDLLVTDVVMPGLDGGGLAAALREARPGLRVLFVSGYARELLGERVPAGAELLPKPFVPEEVLARVAEVLAAEPPSPAAR